MSFPLLLISVFCLLYLLLFLYSLSYVRCEMHLCLREAAGAESGILYKDESAMRLGAAERKAWRTDAADLFRERLREAPIRIRANAFGLAKGILVRNRIELETETEGNPFLLMNNGVNKKLNSRKYCLSPVRILRLKSVLSGLGEGIWGDPEEEEEN